MEGCFQLKDYFSEDECLFMDKLTWDCWIDDPTLDLVYVSITYLIYSGLKSNIFCLRKLDKIDNDHGVKPLGSEPCLEVIHIPILSASTAILQLQTNSVVKARRVNAFPLTQVYFCEIGSVLKTVHEESDTVKEMRKYYKESRLIRKGDQISIAGIKYKIMECTPLHSGLSHPSTEFIVVKRNNLNGDHYYKKKGIEDHPKFDFHFTSHNETIIPRNKIGTLNNSQIQQMKQFFNMDFDENSTVFMKSSLAVVNGTMNRIMIRDNENPIENVERILKVVYIDDAFLNDDVDIPMLVTPTIQNSFKSDLVSISITQENQNTKSVDHASIERIATPNTTTKLGLEKWYPEIKSWFSVCDRILCHGDIVSIGSKSDYFFRVSCPESKDEPFLISATNTRLSTSPNEIHTYIPPAFRTDDNDGALFEEHDAFKIILKLMKVASQQKQACNLIPWSIILLGSRGVGKTSIVESCANQLGYHFYKVNVVDLIGETEIETYAQLEMTIQKAGSCVPCVLYLDGLHLFPNKKETLSHFQQGFDIFQKDPISGKYPLIICGSLIDQEFISEFQIFFRHRVIVGAPNESIRQKFICQKIPEHSKWLAKQTAGFNLSELRSLMSTSVAIARKRVQKAIDCATMSDVHHAGFDISLDDVKMAVDTARKKQHDSFGSAKIPNVSWEDIGGLSHVKDAVNETIKLPIDHPELFGEGLKKRSGLLFYGPPGSGKTLVAKAIATMFSLNFISVKGPELLNMYIGESEANVRRIFQKARDASPCVIFFDELDSLAPKRGQKGDSGGVMDRIVSQLLAELDSVNTNGSSGEKSVFVIGATNRPDLLDSALLRPGRFDKLLYLGVPTDHESRFGILKALTRKFDLVEGTDLERFVEKCSLNLTGADFYALCTDAMMKAIARKIQVIEQRYEFADKKKYGSVQQFIEDTMDESEKKVAVAEEDFEAALSELEPSVSEAELNRYEIIKNGIING